jgi:hypothetical protein
MSSAAAAIEVCERDLFFDLSPTQSAFVHSDAHIVQLKGPMGEGKTYCGGVATVRHAQRVRMPIQTALVRDTLTNIEIATIPSLKETFGSYISFHKDNRLARIHSSPEITMDLFGIDDPAALSKLMGPQYALIWIEEPAPIVDKANAGVSEDVFRMCVARASRQKGTVMRVQITQNPADETHWSEELANAPREYEKDEETGQTITKETYEIPYGENRYLNPLSRLANKAAFRGDAGKWARYVDGIAAPVMVGAKVTTGYSQQIHFSKKELPVLANCPGVRFWDGWHHPVCIIGQMLPPGKLWIHHACQIADGSGGAVELIKCQVAPLLGSPKYKDKIMNWRDIGDPTMMIPDQSSKTRTTAREIERLLDTRFEAGPARWNDRIGPANTALGTNAPDGSGPLILLSSTAYNLHRALNGGWHWAIDNSKRIIGTVPVKDAAADLGDAFCYGTATLFPFGGAKRVGGEDRRRIAEANARMARSYASSWSKNLADLPPVMAGRKSNRFAELRRY